MKRGRKIVEELSTRANNIIERIGGITSAFEYYKINLSFSNYPQVGEGTNNELVRYFKSYETRDTSCPILKLTNENTINSNRIILNEDELVFCYENFKHKTITQIKNYLERKERSELSHFSYERKVGVINKYFLESYYFNEDKKMGKKSLAEIIKLKASLLKLVKYGDSFSKIDEQNRRNVNKKLIDIFKLDSISSVDIENNPITSILTITALRLEKTANKKPTLTSIINYRYYSDENLEISKMARLLNLSLERVRQYYRKIETNIIPNIVCHTAEVIKDVTCGTFKIYSENILYISQEKLEVNPNRVLNPNNLFFRSVYKELLKDTHIELNEIISLDTVELKSFVKSSEIVFVSKEFLECVKFAALIIWADKQIYDFELAQFQYDTTVLVERFYQEYDTSISAIYLKDVITLIELSKRKIWLFSDAKINQSKKLALKEKVLLLIEELINANEKPIKTAEILSYLNSQNYEIKRNSLLKLLSTNNSRFRMVGAGTWCTPEISNMNGSLRSIIIQLLRKSDSPLHISEIINQISCYRDIKGHSIMSNLKESKSNIFIFFNCKFIGLNDKRYGNYWYKIPKLNGCYFAKKNLSNLTTDEIVSIYDQKYGYPEIHIRYIIENKIV